MKISQREAQRLRKRVDELEKQIVDQNRSWSAAWPGGTHIRTMDASMHSELRAAIKTARMLKHAVVCTVDGQTIMFYGCPMATV